MSFFIGLLVGGFVGLAAAALCIAGRDESDLPYQAGYENGYKKGSEDAGIALGVWNTVLCPYCGKKMDVQFGGSRER